MKENRDVEWLVNWALQAQKVELAVKATLPSGPAVTQSAMIQMAELGVRVDSSSQGERWESARCHDDAIVVLSCIRRLPPEAAGLVLLHGRSGTRPDWCPEGVGCETPVLTAKGKPRRIYRDPIKCKGDLGPMMHWVGLRSEQVEFHRAQYTVWHASMRALVKPMNVELSAYLAKYPNAAGKPWDWSGTRRGKPVVHRSLDAGENI